MRVNIYAEEITTDVELVERVVEDKTFGKRTFYGLRVFLLSPSVLSADPHDDDRNAITFWVGAGTYEHVTVDMMLEGLQEQLAKAKERAG